MTVPSRPMMAVTTPIQFLALVRSESEEPLSVSSSSDSLLEEPWKSSTMEEPVSVAGGVVPRSSA